MIPYNLFHKWYEDTRHQNVLVQVEGEPESEANLRKEVSSSPISERKETVDTATKLNQLDLEKSYRETGGTMLNFTGMNRFFICVIFMICVVNMNGCYPSFTSSWNESHRKMKFSLSYPNNSKIRRLCKNQCCLTSFCLVQS